MYKVFLTSVLIIACLANIAQPADNPVIGFLFETVKDNVGTI